MKNIVYLLLLVFINTTEYVKSQEINPLDFYPYHVGDLRQYIEIPSGQFYSGEITNIDTIDLNTHLIYYNGSAEAFIKILLDSAIVLVDPSMWIPYYKLNYSVGSIWIRDTTTSWWVHFKSQFISEVFNENRETREYHIYEFIPPGDTNGLPGSVEYLVKGIGLYRTTWEGGEIILNGCIINGVQYGTIVGVENEINIVKCYELNQNYPNPFNPTTMIRYEIPAQGFVTIKIFDVLGNEVRILVNEEKPAGSYEIEFDGTNLTSGVYFYTLTAGNFTATKKLILLK